MNHSNPYHAQTPMKLRSGRWSVKIYSSLEHKVVTTASGKTYKAMLANMEKALNKLNGTSTTAVVTIEDALNSYQNSIHSRASSTKANAASYTKTILKHLPPNTPIQTITQSQILALPLKPCHISHLKKTMNLAIRDGHINKSPLHGTPKQKPKKNQSLQQLAENPKLLKPIISNITNSLKNSTTPKEFLTHQRNHLLLLTLLLTGMRISEALSLTWEQSESTSLVISGQKSRAGSKITKTKTEVTKSIPTSPLLHHLFQSHKKSIENAGFTTNTFIFSTFNTKDHGKTALSQTSARSIFTNSRGALTSLSPHSCRHLTNFLLEVMGVNTQVRSSLLGHQAEGSENVRTYLTSTQSQKVKAIQTLTVIIARIIGWDNILPALATKPEEFIREGAISNNLALQKLTNIKLISMQDWPEEHLFHPDLSLSPQSISEDMTPLWL